MTTNTRCASCNKPLTRSAIARGGVRCRTCNNRVIAINQSDALAPQDDWLLEQVKTRSVADVATELGLTRQAVYNRINRAKARAVAT